MQHSTNDRPHLIRVCADLRLASFGWRVKKVHARLRMLGIPRRYIHSSLVSFSGLTICIAPLPPVFLLSGRQENSCLKLILAWLISWAMSFPSVIFAAPAIRDCQVRSHRENQNQGHSPICSLAENCGRKGIAPALRVPYRHSA